MGSKWSWKIAKLADIDVYVHATFFILIGWIALRYWLIEGNIAAVFNGVAFILALFGCVVLHELGHALTARRYGIGTRDIMLLPIGGVASLEGMPEDPKQEIAVALAGPAVNVLIVCVVWLILGVTENITDVTELSLTHGSFLERLMMLNIFLAVFNLIPAFPMDGGRVLRALLAMTMNSTRATHTAGNIGQFIALGLGFLGLLYNPFLILISLFVWIGASAEMEMATIKSSLSGITVGQAMVKDFQTLNPDDQLARAVELTLSGSQKDFPVLANRQIVGFITQTQLLKGLQTEGDQTHVVTWMQDNIEVIDYHEELEKVLQHLESSETRILAVTRNGEFAGLINLDNIMELVKIQTALQDNSHQKSGNIKF
ncbi:MAG: site-2 protease family protein [Gammaproteobacteria bacterium]|nr:site-2 protease family protein [Gammaproteobacteria bacterium]